MGSVPPSGRADEAGASQCHCQRGGDGNAQRAVAAAAAAAAGRAPIGPRADVDVLVERVLELPDHRLRQALPLLQDHPLPPHIHVSSVSHETVLQNVFLNWFINQLLWVLHRFLSSPSSHAFSVLRLASRGGPSRRYANP